MKTDVSFERILSSHYEVEFSPERLKTGDSCAAWYWFKALAAEQHEAAGTHNEDEVSGFSEFFDGRTGHRLDGRMSRICGSLLSSL